MSQAEKHIKLLGCKAKDKVTGFKGVITSVSFELYGCIQVAITPAMAKDGTSPQGKWFDPVRLEIKDGKPIVQVPDFEAGYVAEGKKGADCDKPMTDRGDR